MQFRLLSLLRYLRITSSASSITSASFMVPASMVSFTSVRTVCQPCLPAAPGLTCSRFSSRSGTILRMCECPATNSCGDDSHSRCLMPGAYLPGQPPMCVITTFTPSVVKISMPLRARRASEPSMLPYTARTTGATLPRRSIMLMSPMSPACHISSQSAKCLAQRSSHSEWVSDNMPIRFIICQRLSFLQIQC